MATTRWLTALLLMALTMGPAAASERAAALRVDERLYAGVAGFTAQSRIRVADGVGDNVNTLSDGVMLRFGRTGRPARYDVELARTRFDEADLLLAMASLDYLIPWGDLFSGFTGLVVGYAQVEWRRNDPFGGGADFGVRGKRDEGAVVGLRAGGLIEVTDFVQVEIGYRYLHADFERRFEAADRAGRVQVRNVRMVHAGVNFRF